MQTFEEKPKKRNLETHKSKQKVCDACGHIRKQTDEAPEWQCPCCKVAYDKVTHAYKSEYNKELKENFKKEAQVEKEKEKKLKLGQAGLLGGYFSYLKGVGSACAGVAASPFFKVVGVVVAVISTAYILANSLK